MKNVLVVYKKSVWELYDDTDDHDLLRFKDKHEGDVKTWKKSHDDQQKTLDVVVSSLERLGAKVESVYRADLEGLGSLSRKDLIVSVGGDGTFLEVSHYVEGIPMLGVNSDPNHSVGFYCCSNSRSFRGVLRGLDDHPRTVVNRLKVSRDGSPIIEPVLNDVVLAEIDGMGSMARYLLKVDGVEVLNRKGLPRLESNGVLACTATGSTAYMWNAGGDAMPMDSRQVQIRELLKRDAPSHYADRSVEFSSRTREGIMYVDGKHLKYAFGMGTEIKIEPGLPLTIVGDLARKQKEFLEAQSVSGLPNA